MQNLGEERFLVKGTASAKALRQHHAWGVLVELRNSQKACITGAE